MFNKNEYILIVDDDQVSLGILGELVGDLGYKVKYASNGEEALKLASVYKPSIVLLDIIMPGMDGIEVCSKLKEDPILKNVPVIFITSSTDKEMKIKAFERGGVDYITKPYEPSEVLARVKTHLELFKVRNSLNELVYERTAKLEELDRKHNQAQRIAKLGHWELNFENNIMCWSDEVYSIFGVSPERFKLNFNNFLGFLHPDDKKLVLRELLISRGKNKSCEVTYRLIMSDGSIKHVNQICEFETNNESKIIKAYGTISDISRLKETEKNLQIALRDHNTISECNKALVRAKSEQDLLNDICNIIVRSGGHKMCWVGFKDEDPEVKIVVPVALAGNDDGYVNKIRVSWDDSDTGTGPAGTALKTGLPTVIDSVIDDIWFLPWKDEALKRGYQSVISLPLKDSGDVFGVLTIYASEVGIFDNEEVNLLTELADDLAFGIIALRTNNKLEQTVKALKESEASYRKLVENTAEGICIVNEDDRFLFSNSAANEMFGVGDSGLTGRTLSDFVDTETQNFFTEETKLRRKGKVSRYEFKVTREDGSERYLKVTASPQFDKSNKLLGTFGIILDITQTKKAKEELEQKNSELSELNEKLQSINSELIIAKDKAEQSDKLKSAFLANMSHEIRTPMNGIMGFAEILTEEGLPREEHNEYLEMIMDSGKRMLGIINNIVDMSKIESGHSELEISELCISEQLMQTYNIFRKATEEKNLELVLENNVPDDLMVKTDHHKIYSILSNLLNNAIKYTNSGTITLGCSLKDNSIEYCVRDTGIGIPENKYDIIFNSFVQADMSLTKAYEGAGLGLSISKAYIEMLGGEISFKSQVTKGTTFWIKIPVDVSVLT